MTQRKIFGTLVPLGISAGAMLLLSSLAFGAAADVSHRHQVSHALEGLLIGGGILALVFAFVFAAVLVHECTK